MKKILSIMLAVTASAFFCNASIAADKPLLMQQVAASTNSCAPYTSYATCVSVTNLSRYVAQVYVPALAVNIYVNPGYSQPIVSNLYYAGVDIAIPNIYGSQYFYVPNRGDLEIPPFSKKMK